MEKSKEKRRGKLVVFEGVDGSGKSTQSEYLKEYLKGKKITFAFFKFPRHGKKVFGKLVDDYLGGKFGNPVKVSPYFASFLYAADRFEIKSEIEEVLEEKDWVIIDRFVDSNLAHQRVKFRKKKDWLAFTKWLRDLEFGKMKLPRPDKVLYFRVPLKEIRKRLRAGDGHERDLDYLGKVKKAYEAIAKLKKEWQIIGGEEKGRILTPKEVFGKVKKALNFKD